MKSHEALGNYLVDWRLIRSSWTFLARLACESSESGIIGQVSPHCKIQETYVGVRKTRHSIETKQSSHILKEFFNRKINHSHPVHSESGARGHNQYHRSCVLEAACVWGVGFLARGHNQYRNKCHLIPPSCSWSLPWVGLPRVVSFDSREKKMCPSIAWHRARLARTFQTHHGGGEAAKAVPVTHEPAQRAPPGPARLLRSSALARR